MSEAVEGGAAGKNFRSAYYETLGFRENEKSISQLESQIKLEVIDLPKLKSFCLKSTLPVFYRPLVWKLLLGVEPHLQDPETRQYIISQKAEQYRDLKQALPVCLTGQARQSRSSASPENLVYMFGLEKRRLADVKRDSGLYKDLVTVAKPFMDWFEDEMDAYYCFVGFTAIIDEIKPHLQNMIDESISFLAQKEPVLYQHLVKLNILSVIPFRRWFQQCLVTDLPLADVEIVWDRLIAGSYSILLYIAVSMILHRKRLLLSLRSAEQVAKLFETLTEDDSSLILKQGFELWEHNGSPLIPGNSKK